MPHHSLNVCAEYTSRWKKEEFQSTEQQNHIQTFLPKKSRHKEIWLL